MPAGRLSEPWSARRIKGAHEAQLKASSSLSPEAGCASSHPHPKSGGAGQAPVTDLAASQLFFRATNQFGLVVLVWAQTQPPGSNSTFENHRDAAPGAIPPDARAEDKPGSCAKRISPDARAGDAGTDRTSIASFLTSVHRR